jgi:glycosyltransferase involved in cell wall biosynthesis
MKITNYVSIIIPVKNEEKYIRKCINSVLKGSYPTNLIEIIVVDGLSEDNTREIVRELMKDNNNIKLLINLHETVPFAMNMGIKNSKGDIIVRLDAHAEYSDDYIEKCVFLLNKYKADNVGGCIETKNSEDTKISRSIAKVLSHKFGVGNSDFRTLKEEKEVDTVPFGAFRREIFDKVGLYNELLTRNQDIELNGRIKKNGGKIILSPEIKCIYYARTNLRSFWVQNYQNGKWNIYTASIAKHSLSIRHFVPFLFVFSLFLSFLILIYSYELGILISGLILIPYLLFSFYFSFSIAKEEKELSLIPYLITSFITLHISYGIGSLSGILSVRTFLKKSKSREGSN